MWLVAVIRLLRYWRVSADSLCLSKKPLRIFPVYAFIYSEFSASHFWQCRHLRRIAPSQENFQELSDTSSAWYTWETIELIASGAPDFDYSHIILFFLSVIFLGKKQKWNADNEFKKQGNWNLVLKTFKNNNVLRCDAVTWYVHFSVHFSRFRPSSFRLFMMLEIFSNFLAWISPVSAQ